MLLSPTIVGDSGILTGAYPPSGPLVTAQFNVPTGEYLEFKLSIATFSGTGLMWTISPGPAEGSATSKADFGSTLHLPTSGPVFNLPPGYNVNSIDAGIVDNAWTAALLTAPSPEPNYCGDLGTVFLDADLSQDCYVALHDFGLFNLQWQETDCNSTTWCNGADIDQNTVVGLPDLKLFFAQWLWCTEPYDPSCDIYW